MAGAVMRRGQFVTIATEGDYGKPRPAIVVQSDLFAALPSVVICPLRRRGEIIKSSEAVMAGLVPAIHVVQIPIRQRFATVLPLLRKVLLQSSKVLVTLDVNGRDKPGHDGFGAFVSRRRLTSTVRDDADQFRLDVEPSADNGLRVLSQIAIDKITVVPNTKIGAVIGAADGALMVRVSRALALFLGLV